MATMTDAPVIHRPTLRSLEEIVPSSLKAVFYVNNAVKNTHFIERREIAISGSTTGTRKNWRATTPCMPSMTIFSVPAKQAWTAMHAMV